MYGCFGGTKNTDHTNEVTVRRDSTVEHLETNHGENQTKLNSKTIPLKIERHSDNFSFKSHSGPTSQTSPQPKNCIRLSNLFCWIRKAQENSSLLHRQNCSPFQPKHNISRTPSFTKRPGLNNTTLWRKTDLNASLYLTILTTLRSIFSILHVTQFIQWHR